PFAAGSGPRGNLCEFLGDGGVLFVAKHLVAFGGGGEVGTVEVPSGDGDVGIFGEAMRPGERQPFGTRKAAFDQFDASRHGGTDGTADADGRNSQYTLRHKKAKFTTSLRRSQRHRRRGARQVRA